jgi:2-aminoadipate transaminase
MMLVEDDPYSQLRYEGEAQMPLLAIDAQVAGGIENGNVLYLGTFSKTLCPGFRVAWMVGPSAVIGRVTQAKQGADLHTSTFTQMVAYETARDGFVEKHVETIREVYGARRDLMLSMLEETFPAGVTWTHPQGGLFLWVRLPEELDSAALLPKAVANKVAFVPGHAFFAEGGGANTMRMNFSNATEEQIEAGILRLAEVLAAEMEAAAV